MTRAETIQQARTVTLPGGVKLTAAELRFRARPRPYATDWRMARSILAKVAAAISGEGT